MSVPGRSKHSSKLTSCKVVDWAPGPSDASLDRQLLLPGMNRDSLPTGRATAQGHVLHPSCAPKGPVPVHCVMSPSHKMCGYHLPHKWHENNMTNHACRVELFWRVNRWKLYSDHIFCRLKGERSHNGAQKGLRVPCVGRGSPPRGTSPQHPASFLQEESQAPAPTNCWDVSGCRTGKSIFGRGQTLRTKWLTFGGLPWEVLTRKRGVELLQELTGQPSSLLVVTESQFSFERTTSLSFSACIA